MNHYRISLVFLFLLCLNGSVQMTNGQTPAPAIQAEFQLALSDGTAAAAVFLPTLDGKMYLIYSTNSGKIGLWVLVSATAPLPPDPHPVVTSVNIITITETTAATADNNLQSFLALKKGKFSAYTVASVGEANPPAEALKWVGRTAGKTYPYTFAIDQNENIIWEGTTPGTTAELIAKISGLKIDKPPLILPPPAATAPNTCPGGVCPTVQTRRRR